MGFVFGNTWFVSFQIIFVPFADKVPSHAQMFVYVELKQKLFVGLTQARRRSELGFFEDPPNNMISPLPFCPRKKPLTDRSSSGTKE